MGFPPNLSVRIPAGSRKMDPARTGTPINHPNSTGPQSKTWLEERKVMRTPFSIQAAKQTVNATVLSVRTLYDVRVAFSSKDLSWVGDGGLMYY